MKVTAAVTFTVPDHCDADSLASLLDAVGRALRGDGPIFIHDADVPAFRLGDGAWTVKAGGTFKP